MRLQILFPILFFAATAAAKPVNIPVVYYRLPNGLNVVSEEVRANVLNQPYALFEWLDLWQNANSNWFNAHNFYGDLHDIEAAKIDDVRQFFKAYYAPNNAVLAVVGDVDADAVRKMIEKHFGDIPLQSVPERPDVSEAKH